MINIKNNNNCPAFTTAAEFIDVEIFFSLERIFHKCLYFCFVSMNNKKIYLKPSHPDSV